MSDDGNPTAAATTTVNGGDEENKKPFSLDFQSIIAAESDRPPDEVVVVAADRRRRSAEKRRRPEKSPAAEGEDLSRMKDEEIESRIESQLKTYEKVGKNLKDKGAKLKANVENLKAELERRRMRRDEQDASPCKKPMDSESPSSDGVLEGQKLVAPSSQPLVQSKFGACFLRMLGDDAKLKLEPKNPEQETEQESNAFDEESKACDEEMVKKRRRKPDGKIPQNKRSKPDLYSKGFSAWKCKPSNQPRNGKKYMSLNGLAGRAPVKCSLPLTKESIVDSLTNKDASQTSDGSKKDQTVVLVDEEEPEAVPQKHEAEQLPSSNDEGKIYYPSREDPETLEILHSELKCLDPGECLTSTIMNFYTRFLQESQTERSQHNFYFFNTYFYSKLQKAVGCKKNDKEAYFIKFRRWWRGVNIFQKAYIFLPINEDNHWSLVIICIPDEEDESGPILLHLDSLGLHYSRSIFQNIKSLLINEWDYLKEEKSLDVRIPERIWKHLPRRIDEKIIMVPRQTNEYDCGLFVLYYMERFIKEAPPRLKRQELSSMFGKNWFKPQEASSLRGKIKKILQEKFHETPTEENQIWEPVSLSTNAQTEKSKDEVEKQKSTE